MCRARQTLQQPFKPEASHLRGAYRPRGDMDIQYKRSKRGRRLA